MAEPLKINRGRVDIFEQTNYPHGEEKAEVEQILSWSKKIWNWDAGRAFIPLPLPGTALP